MDHVNECKFCKKVFCDKSTLNRHQRRKKLCINITNDELITIKNNNETLKNNNENLKDKNFELEENIDNMKEEMQILKERIFQLKGENRVIKAEMDEMQNKLIACVNKGHNINQINNIIIINNPKPFGKECFNLDNYDIFKHLLRGILGMVDFIHEYIKLNNNDTNYVCMDASRYMCKRLTNDNIWKPDAYGNYLRQTISELFRGKTGAIMQKLRDELDKENMDDFTKISIINQCSIFLLNIKENDAKTFREILKELAPRIKRTSEELKLIEFV